jgi:hypothetical protein
MGPREDAEAGWGTAGLTAAAMLAFAANSLLCRAALGGAHADAATFTLLRLAAGALALSVLARVRGSPGPPPRPEWGSALALFAYALGFSLAYQLVPVGAGALLVRRRATDHGGRRPAHAGERPRTSMGGHALSIAGVVALTRPEQAPPNPSAPPS